MKKQTSIIDKFETVKLTNPELVKGGTDSAPIIIDDETLG